MSKVLNIVLADLGVELVVFTGCIWISSSASLPFLSSGVIVGGLVVIMAALAMRKKGARIPIFLMVLLGIYLIVNWHPSS